MSTDELRRPVIVVDDSEADRDAVERAYRRVAPDQPLVFCSTADEAITEMETRAAGATGAQPALAIIDVNMPERGGLELLATLRERFPLVPVLMLSGSARPDDVRIAYQRGVAGFFVKPMGLAALTDVIEVVDRYWNQTATLAFRHGAPR